MANQLLGGRFGDRLSFSVALGVFLLITVGCGFAYSAGDVLRRGDKPCVDALDPFYFSFVTATTVGYGDITPVGWGRALACVQILTSLILGGTLASQLLDVRRRKWDGAFRACGTWIERSVRTNGEPIVSEVTIQAVGTSLRMTGESFDDEVTKSLGPFRGELRANDYPTLVFRYEDRTTSATNYTRGYFSLVVTEGKGLQTRYDGESIDEKHGCQDQVRGYLITDEPTLRLLANPETRLATLRELRRNVL